MENSPSVLFDGLVLPAGASVAVPVAVALPVGSATTNPKPGILLHASGDMDSQTAQFIDELSKYRHPGRFRPATVQWSRERSLARGMFCCGRLDELSDLSAPSIRHAAR